jgi:anti-anti-sigma factor
MALVRQEVKGEIRIMLIDQARLVEGTMIDQCYREIIEALDKSEEANVLLHFGRLTFMSSMALGMLIRVNKKCKEYEVTLKLCNITPDIREVFKLTGMDKVFDIHNDAAGAMTAFKESGQLMFRKKKPSSYDLT